MNISENHIIIKTYLNEKKDKNYINHFNIDINIKIIDMKNNILNYLIDNNIIENNKYNYLELENITDRIYKDYGKLFFDIGILPNTIDNYKINQFTGDKREFIMIIRPVINNINNNVNTINNLDNNDFFNKYMKKSSVKENKVIKDNKNKEFELKQDDFPPL